MLWRGWNLLESVEYFHKSHIHQGHWLDLVIRPGHSHVTIMLCTRDLNTQFGAVGELGLQGWCFLLALTLGCDHCAQLK